MSDGPVPPKRGCLTTLITDLAKATPAQLGKINTERVAADRGLRLDFVRGYLARERQARR
jgi:hypothetical protein